MHLRTKIKRKQVYENQYIYDGLRYDNANLEFN